MRERRRKIFKRPSGTSTETGWQDIKVSILGTYHRHIATRSDSRSGRVSSRSVALFVNAELRARARVTGSSRKASWGFMVLSPPPSALGSEETKRREPLREKGR